MEIQQAGAATAAQVILQAVATIMQTQFVATLGKRNCAALNLRN